MNIMRQTACLVVNPITVNNFAVLFNCLMKVQALKLFKLLKARHSVFGRALSDSLLD